MIESVITLKAENECLKQRLAIFETHHAACRIHFHEPPLQQPSAVQPPHESPQPIALDTGSDGSLELIPFDVSSLGKRARAGAIPSGPAKRKKESKPQWLSVVESLVKDIDLSSRSHAAEPASLEIPHLITSVQFETLKVEAIETDALIQKADAAVNKARVRLFCFLSHVVALENSGNLTAHKADQLMELALPTQSVDFRRRVRDGAGWMHKNLIAELLRRGWELDKATTVVARCESHAVASCALLTRLQMRPSARTHTSISRTPTAELV